ncbi:Gfo/Idh/MocA family oxidoreductase [Arcanobacterium phocisimile]|uniref:Gfo/Idh/MocA family oxidoreductase n=1 Tax=Arcanobacterium phocisimile TaxID=1302235 RepID=A0ABX7II51_9ACTO|nr:Gfo/Idh/MocA family oxidoreductase [Arcanobacterium phocisimile]QRV02214.1 Gfo/Idh/MocA family oxidoreductase [Arcanobacterium phocisimile]
MTKKNSLGVGVISLGWMGRLHTRSYKAMAELYPELDLELRLVLACDPVLENQQLATDVLGFEKAVSDYHELINDPEVDVISICSPNYLHKEIALAVAKSGKPFWIEKPMGISAQQAAEIAQAVNGKNIITSVGFNYRHTPAIEEARKLISEGKLGTITNVRCWLIADYASSPQGPYTWRYDRSKAGAGVVGDLLSHGSDLVQYVLRDAITSVSATTGTFITERPIPTKMGVGHTGWEVSDEMHPVENEDYVAAIIRTAGGVLGTIESNRVAVGPRAEYQIEVYGTDGSIRWNFEKLNDLEVCIGQDQGTVHGYTRSMANPNYPHFSRFQPGAGTSMGFDDMKAVECFKFLSGVLTGEQIGPSVADGWSAAEIDEAIVKSAQDGKWHNVHQVSGKITFAQ